MFVFLFKNKDAAAGGSFDWTKGSAFRTGVSFSD